MKTTADFLDALRVKLDLPSDGRLAAFLGIHRQYLSRYRRNVITFDDEMAMKVADLLDTDPAYVVACMHAQRAKTVKEQKLWERIATLSAGITVCLVLSAALPVQNADKTAISMVSSIGEEGALYIMSNLPAYLLITTVLLFSLALRRRPRVIRP